MFIQICNHNYLLADGYHRLQDYRPLLKDYRALIVDEAHKLPDVIGENHRTRYGLKEEFHMTEECAMYLYEGIQTMNKIIEKLGKKIPKWIRNKLEETRSVLECFFHQDKKYVLHLKQDQEHRIILCASSRRIPQYLDQMLRDEIPFPMIEVWRHSPEEITRFKQTDNAVLFAVGSCWEGVDFPGDMVSSLIIVKLPFAVPDPISEAQKKEYDCLKDYIQAVVVPDMQKKLRQGFGRALRTETDTCVVSILDERAGEEGRYHEEVMCALPKCKMTKDIKDVQRFIRNRKGVEYYL